MLQTEVMWLWLELVLRISLMKLPKAKWAAILEAMKKLDACFFSNSWKTTYCSSIYRILRKILQHKTCYNELFNRHLQPWSGCRYVSEMPKYHTFNQSSNIFQRRNQGNTITGYPNIYSADAIGRIYSVVPNNGECFYLRLLLVNVRGPT